MILGDEILLLWGQSYITDKIGDISYQISLFLAQEAKFVRSVEIIPQVIDNANKNARINHINNVGFFAGEVEEVLPVNTKETASMQMSLLSTLPARAATRPFWKP